MMRLRKLFAVICILAVSCLSLCAMTVEQLYAKALENSKTVFEMQKTRYFDFLDSVMASMGGPSWQISLQGAEFSFVDDFQGRTYQLPSLEVSYSSPEKPGKLTFNSSFNLSNIKFESSKDFKPGSFDISLHGGVSKSYEFKSWDATDYSKGWSDTVKAIEYDNSMLRFQNTFLQDIIDYLTLYKSGVKVAYEASVAASQNVQNLIDGKYKEDSEEGIRRDTEVKVKIKEQELFEQSLKEKTAELTEKYGLTEEQLLEVEEAGTYDLSMTIADQGNYEVHSKYLEVLSLEQQIDEKLGRSSTLTLKAGLDPKLNINDELKYGSTVLDGDIGVSYSTGKLNLDLSVKTGYNFNADTPGQTWTGPTISVGGSWSNTPQVLSNAEIARLRAMYSDNNYMYETVLRDLSNNQIRKELLEIDKLEDSLVAAYAEWDSALSEYRKKFAELSNKIRDYKNELELLKITYEGEMKIHDGNTAKLEKGEMTFDDFLIADIKPTEAALDLLIKQIEGLILYNEIQMLQR